mgnify:FL=1
MNRFNIFKRYNYWLTKYPYRTNAITTGTLFGTGDIIAQKLFTKEDEYDYKRTIRATIYGSVIFSVVGDKWYKLLNNLKLSNSMRGIIVRVGIDQIIFAPFGLVLYYTSMTILSGGYIKDIRQKLSNQWWPTLYTNWLIWPWIQIINFSIVPVQYRLLCVNAIALLWNTFLSLRNAQD